MDGNFGASLACVELMHVAKPEWTPNGWCVCVHVPKPFWGWFQSLICWHRYFGMKPFYSMRSQPWANHESWSLLCISKIAGMWFKPQLSNQTYMNDNMSKYLYHSGIFLTILFLLLLLLYLYIFLAQTKINKNPLQNKENKVKQTKTFYYYLLFFKFSFTLAIKLKISW